MKRSRTPSPATRRERPPGAKNRRADPLERVRPVPPRAGRRARRQGAHEDDRPLRLRRGEDRHPRRHRWWDALSGAPVAASTSAASPTCGAATRPQSEQLKSRAATKTGTRDRPTDDPGVAVDVCLHRDAVVAADRCLRESLVVGQKTARGGTGRARWTESARRSRPAGARLRVAGDGALDGQHERGAGGEALLVGRVRGRAGAGRGPAVRAAPGAREAERVRRRPRGRRRRGRGRRGRTSRSGRSRRRRRGGRGRAAPAGRDRASSGGGPAAAGADEHGPPAARAPLAGRVLGEAAVGAGALHLTSVDIVAGYRQAVPVDHFDPGPPHQPAPGRLGLVPGVPEHVLGPRGARGRDVVVARGVWAVAGRARGSRGR